MHVTCSSPLLPNAQTANAGASSLQLQDPVTSWEAGQQAVLTTTIWKDEQVGSLAALAMHEATCSSLVGECTRRRSFHGLGRCGAAKLERQEAVHVAQQRQVACASTLPEALCAVTVCGPALCCLQENQNEVVTISGVSSDGRTVYLAQPLQYQHYGCAVGSGERRGTARPGPLRCRRICRLATVCHLLLRHTLFPRRPLAASVSPLPHN